MGNVAVVTDSVATIPDSVVRELGIRVVPILLHHEGRTYRDGIDLTASQFYRMLRTSEQLPTSSTASVGDIAEVYTEAARGSDGVVAIHVAARLSAVHKTAVLAAQSVDAPIRIVDSRTATMAQGFVAVEAARTAAAGADLESVAARAEDMTNRVRFYAFFETLEYLHRGGRIGGAAALFGSALKFKPIIHLVDGEVQPYARPRTRRRATQRLVDIMAEQVGGRPVHAAIMQADCADDAEELRRRVAEQFNCVELYVTEFTPVMGTHTGPGLLGVAFHLAD